MYNRTVKASSEIFDGFEIEIYGNLANETIDYITETWDSANIPFKHFKTTSVGYIRESFFKQVAAYQVNPFLSTPVIMVSIDLVLASIKAVIFIMDDAAKYSPAPSKNVLLLKFCCMCVGGTNCIWQGAVFVPTPLRTSDYQLRKISS